MMASRVHHSVGKMRRAIRSLSKNDDLVEEDDDFIYYGDRNYVDDQHRNPNESQHHRNRRLLFHTSQMSQCSLSQSQQSTSTVGPAEIPVSARRRSQLKKNSFRHGIADELKHRKEDWSENYFLRNSFEEKGIISEQNISKDEFVDDDPFASIQKLLDVRDGRTIKGFMETVDNEADISRMDNRQGVDLFVKGLKFDNEVNANQRTRRGLIHTVLQEDDSGPDDDKNSDVHDKSNKDNFCEVKCIDRSEEKSCNQSILRESEGNINLDLEESITYVTKKNRQNKLDTVNPDKVKAYGSSMLKYDNQEVLTNLSSPPSNTERCSNKMTKKNRRTRSNNNQTKMESCSKQKVSEMKNVINDPSSQKHIGILDKNTAINDKVKADRKKSMSTPTRRRTLLPSDKSLDLIHSNSRSTGLIGSRPAHWGQHKRKSMSLISAVSLQTPTSTQHRLKRRKGKGEGLISSLVHSQSTKSPFSHENFKNSLSNPRVKSLSNSFQSNSLLKSTSMSRCWDKNVCLEKMTFTPAFKSKSVENGDKTDMNSNITPPETLILTNYKSSKNYPTISHSSKRKSSTPSGRLLVCLHSLRSKVFGNKTRLRSGQYPHLTKKNIKYAKNVGHDLCNPREAKVYIDVTLLDDCFVPFEGEKGDRVSVLGFAHTLCCHQTYQNHLENNVKSKGNCKVQICFLSETVEDYRLKRGMDIRLYDAIIIFPNMSELGPFEHIAEHKLYPIILCTRLCEPYPKGLSQLPDIR